MRQPGRKSAASMSAAMLVDRKPPRLDPPPHLTTEGRSMFNELVACSGARHFVKSDTELLSAFVTVSLLVRKPNGFAQWEKAVRLQASLAAKLRLCPSARCDPKTIGRATPDNDLRKPWESDKEFKE